MAESTTNPSQREPSGGNLLQGFSTLNNFLRPIITPLLAIITALFLGAIIILLVGRDPLTTYEGLLEGALLEPRGLVGTLLKMSPFMLSALAFGVAFKGGLLNIGAQGQLIMGSVAAAWIGATDLGIHPLFHITLGITAAIVVGGLWGAIPGALKAYTEAHEVITTIMFNFIASRIAEWMISLGSADGSIPAGPLADPNGGALARTEPVVDSATLPVVFTVPGATDDLNIGIFIAIAAALFMLILLNRTTFGFELRMTGLNPDAAQYAGVNVKRMTIMTMAISGALAGLAGAIQTLGVNGHYEANQSLASGFDGITVSLLAANHPVGTIFSSFLFGAMDQGTTRMQGTGVETELILVIQALILIFIAAPQIIYYLYRLRSAVPSSH